ncbi:hypothetical protein I350_08044 [Cryptococcus amylolentus CBS 6273]|uniref:Nuclear speckle splicing regulatory protein 1 N-terminal domain-containing protein n=1 Tax=Cryptococcus amylolentus CBS 6273 TaxID=1296118 RepID=A0A1E3J8R5_9TREE|nr:hypothetical protein I350_08044 [Cryptococcus amylolentus CBS 6273]
MSGKISFSFGAKPGDSKTSTQSKAPVSKAPSAALFADEDEGEDEEGGSFLASSSAKASSSSTKKHAVKAPAIQQSSQISRAERKAQATARSIDQSIFDYDAHYDQMKAAERAVEEEKKKESDERKPKYIESFLASAQTRKLDRLRAEEKMLEREREQEGDEFADKDKFVTEAYKKQMAEVRKAEEEEKAREEALRKGQKGPGLTAFYKNMLDSEESKHAAAVAASEKPTMGPSLAIRPPPAPSKPLYDEEEEYDPFLAREAKNAPSSTSAAPPVNGQGGLRQARSTRIDDATGKEVEINDDGEVIDKRSLLKAGLNIMKKPKTEVPNSLTSSQRSATVDGPYQSKAVGSAASYRDRMERERRRLDEQYRELEEIKKREEQDRLRQEEEEARRRREGDNGEAERKRAEAKERYLARKRARDEEEKSGVKKAREQDQIG